MVLEDLKVLFFHVGKAGGSTIERVISSFSKDKDLIHHPNKSPLYGKTVNPDDFELRKKYMMGFLSHEHRINDVWGTYLQHADIRIHEAIHDKKHINYFKFAFVRNPYDRILSAYYYNGYDAQMGFNEFVDKVLIHKYEANFRYSPLHNNHFAPQHLFTHKNGYQYVNFIGKLEHIKDDLDFVLDYLMLKYDKKIPVLAKTKKSKEYNNYMDAYDKYSIMRVNNLYELDFKIFNYERL